MDGYCEADDVRSALQDAELSGPTNADLVEDEIVGVSTYIRKTSRRHFYDSGGTASDLVPTDDRAISNVRLDVPSSPHAQRDQIHRHDRGVRYPVTTDGPYARISLLHGYVDSLTSLRIRDRSGDVTDWTTDSEFVRGVGEDYFVRREDAEGFGASYLYVRAASIGARRDFSGLVVADYQYGLDEQTESWRDVRRGVAQVAAAGLHIEDDTVTAIEDSGQLVNVQTKAEQLFERGMRKLEPYL